MDVLGRRSTPGGTLIPEGTPPRTPTPTFGSPQYSVYDAPLPPPAPRDASDCSRPGGGAFFAPGDRTWCRLPELCSPNDEEASIRAVDWITQVTPIMGDLAPASAGWWSRVLEVADKAYRCWQAAPPLETWRTPWCLLNVGSSQLVSVISFLHLSLINNG